MNRKGFTLVELLTVVIILALIALLVVTGVTKLVKNSRENLSDIQLSSLKESASIWAVENTEFLPDDNECIYMTLGYLKDYGLVNEKVIDAKTSNDLSDNLFIKISAELSEYNKLIYNYEIIDNINDLNNCTLKEIQATTIITGQEFNEAIKTLANGSEKAYSDLDTVITNVGFYSYGRLPDGYTKETLTALNGVDVSANQDNSIMAYYDDNGSIYVYSENRIFSNENSNLMFIYLSNATNIDLSDLDTSQATTMRSFFAACASLKEIDVSNLDTSNVVDMYGMFVGTRTNQMNLEKIIGLENFDTSKVESLAGMFQHCIKLKSLDLSDWDVSNVKNFSYMFNNNLSLETLDLSGWNTKKVTTMLEMFYGTTNLTCVQVGKNWQTATTNTDMFTNSGISEVSTNYCLS